MNQTKNLTRDGCRHFAGAASNGIAELETLLATLPNAGAGSRIAGAAALVEWLKKSLHGVVAETSPTSARPVRAILFDKTPASNWSLGWHQDRTICVKERVETPGFGPWTVKHGLNHVEPPFDYIERLITLRIHLDPVDEHTAPLLVALGSHCVGKVAGERAAQTAKEHQTFACLAESGDVWAYATPILHASERNRSGNRRRVLQVDYSPDMLPGGLAWLGVG